MSKRGADWYKREPRAFLEGVRRMSEREIAVYAVVLDLIYDGGHDTYDDPKHIASYFSDLGSAAVRKAIDALVDAGKLIRRDGKLTNKRAENEGKTREELKENRRKAGRNGGVSSGNSRSNASEINYLDEAKPTDTRAKDKRREEIEDKESSSSQPAAAKENGALSRKKSLEAEFNETFWPAYPRKVEKKDALKAFLKARATVSLEMIMAGLGQFAADVAGKDPQYIRHASKWLNAESWNNGPDSRAAVALVVDDEIWSKRLNFGRTSNCWQTSKWGPAPGMPGCIVPSTLIQPDDGVGWREWEQAA